MKDDLTAGEKRLCNERKCCDIDVGNENRRPEPLRSMTYKQRIILRGILRRPLWLAKVTRAEFPEWEKGGEVRSNKIKQGRRRNSNEE